MKPALLVIDVQKRFFKNETARHSLEAAIEYINAAIGLFREKSLPVVCIQNQSNRLVPSDEDFDGPESLNIRLSDPHFIKARPNAFTEPAFLAHLRQLDVDTVIITGYSAEYCVLSTCHGAEDNDLCPIILRGSLASRQPENIPFVENISELISYEALAKVLENCQ